MAQGEGHDWGFSRIRTLKVSPIKDGAVVYIIAGGIGAGKSTLGKHLADCAQRKGKKVCFVAEPVGRWEQNGSLPAFYKDPKRFGLMFQSQALSSRCCSILEAFAENPDCDVYIIERSPPFDQIFMTLLRDTLLTIPSGIGSDILRDAEGRPVVDPVGSMELDVYAQWCDAFYHILPFRQEDCRVVYLNPKIEECMRRVNKRGREGEIVASEADDDGSAKGGVHRGYQERLVACLEAFLFGRGDLSRFPVLPYNPYKPENVIELTGRYADEDYREDPELFAAIYERVMGERDSLTPRPSAGSPVIFDPLQSLVETIRGMPECERAKAASAALAAAHQIAVTSATSRVAEA